MDGCAVGSSLLPDAQSQRQEGGHRLQAQCVDLFHRARGGTGSCQWPLRQVPDGKSGGWGSGSRQDDGAVVVQHLPVWNDAGDAACAVVAEASSDNTFPVGLGGHLRLHFPQRSRLHVFLFAESFRCHDFHCVDGAPFQRGGQLPVWSGILPRTQSESKSMGFGARIAWNGVLVYRFEINIRIYFAI